MDYMDSVKKAIDYIENHLQSDMKAEEIAQEAGFSPYHFHRIFQSITRISVSQYVRKRRLTEAAYELFHSNTRILELALKYQFESQEAFTRAFKKMFYITPGEFRKQPNMKKTLFRVMEIKPLDHKRLHHIQESLTMDPVFAEKKSFQVIGIEMHSSENDQFGILWYRFIPRIKEIETRVNPGFLYGVIEPSGTERDYHYIACAEVSGQGNIPADMVYKFFPASSYAVFTHKGSLDKLTDTYQYIYGAWFPKSGKVRTNGPEFEMYGEKFSGPMDEDSEFDIYIPILP